MSLMMLSRLFVMFILRRTSLVRIMEVLDEAVEIRNDEKSLSAGYDIEFFHVSFSYDKKSEHNVLKDINLKIPQGATVGILGGTGSSNSTLVQLIPRLYDATDGKVLLGGKDVREWDLEALRRK